MASQPQKKDDEVIGKCLDCKLSHEETGEKNTSMVHWVVFFRTL